MSETGDSFEIFGSGQLDLWDIQAREAAKKAEWDELTSDGYLQRAEQNVGA